MFVTDTPTLHAIRAGVIIWNPTTDAMLRADVADPTAVAEADAAVQRCLRDGYAGHRPHEWVALEAHYRSEHPKISPPCDTDSREYHVETQFFAYAGKPWVADGIVIVGQDDVGDPVALSFEAEDAEALAHLILYRLGHPQPVPKDLQAPSAVIEVSFGTGAGEE